MHHTSSSHHIHNGSQEDQQGVDGPGPVCTSRSLACGTNDAVTLPLPARQDQSVRIWYVESVVSRCHETDLLVFMAGNDHGPG